MDNSTGRGFGPKLIGTRIDRIPHQSEITGKEPLELEIVEKDGMYDKDNPRSLYNLLTPTMQEHLEGAKNFFLYDLSDESIRKNISHMREYPLLQKLRQSFWLEHQRVQDNGRARMENTRIWQGICDSSGHFYSLMKRPEFAAFVFTQPVAMEVRNLSLAETAWTRMMEIMSVSPVEYDAQGKPAKVNDKLARVQLEVWKHADERLQGGALKRVAVTSDHKSVNVNLNQDTKTVTHQLDLSAISDPVELKRRIEELKRLIPEGDIITTATVVEDEDE
jgi:hypothetical protein